MSAAATSGRAADPYRASLSTMFDIYITPFFAGFASSQSKVSSRK